MLLGGRTEDPLTKPSFRCSRTHADRNNSSRDCRSCVAPAALVSDGSATRSPVWRASERPRRTTGRASQRRANRCRRHPGRVSLAASMGKFLAEDSCRRCYRQRQPAKVSICRSASCRKAMRQCPGSPLLTGNKVVACSTSPRFQTVARAPRTRHMQRARLLTGSASM